MPLNIWDLAKQQVEQQQKRSGGGQTFEEAAGQNENKQEKKEEPIRENSHVILCGSKDAGKTSLILRFLDRNEETKPTIALEYTFGRRTRANCKEVAHIWELGSDTWLTNLLPICIKAENLQDSSILLVVDLSQPETLWLTMSRLIAAVDKYVNEAFTTLRRTNAQAAAEMEKNAWARYSNLDSQERNLVKPLMIPLAIVGAKYDLFQNTDSEKKKVITKTLRFMAHLKGASLHYYSNKMEALVTRGRAVMSQLAFNTIAGRTVTTDHQKPVSIPHGMDSFSDIGLPPLEDQALAQIHASDPLQLWEAAFCHHFPQKEVKQSKDDPVKDPQYKEASIDQLRMHKDQVL